MGDLTVVASAQKAIFSSHDEKSWGGQLIALVQHLKHVVARACDLGGP